MARVELSLLLVHSVLIIAARNISLLNNSQDCSGQTRKRVDCSSYGRLAVPRRNSAFVCVTDGYFPDPSSCQHFNLCIRNIAYQYQCVGNSVYYHAAAMCVTPRSGVTCSTTTCTSQLIGTYQLYTQDPNVFIVCLDSTPPKFLVAACQHNYTMNAEKSTCQPACLGPGRYPASPGGTTGNVYYECVEVQPGKYMGPVQKQCPGWSVFSKQKQRCVSDSRSSFLTTESQTSETTAKMTLPSTSTTDRPPTSKAWKTDTAAQRSTTAARSSAYSYASGGITITEPSTTKFAPQSENNTSDSSSVTPDSATADPVTPLSNTSIPIPSLHSPITPIESETLTWSTRIDGSTNNNFQSVSTSAALPNTGDFVTSKSSASPPFTTEFGPDITSRSTKLPAINTDTTTEAPYPTFSDIGSKAPTPDEKDTPSESEAATWPTSLAKSTNYDPSSESASSALTDAGASVTDEPTETQPPESTFVLQSSSQAYGLSSNTADTTKTDSLTTYSDIATVAHTSDDKGTRTESGTANWSTAKAERTHTQSVSTSSALPSTDYSAATKSSSTPMFTNDLVPLLTSQTYDLSSVSLETTSPTSADRKTSTDSEASNLSTTITEKTNQDPTNVSTSSADFVPISTSQTSASVTSDMSTTDLLTTLADISTAAPTSDKQDSTSKSDSANWSTLLAESTSQNPSHASTSPVLPNGGDSTPYKSSVITPFTTELVPKPSSQSSTLSGVTSDTAKPDPFTTFSYVETIVPTSDEQDTPSQSGATSMSTSIPDTTNQNPQSASSSSALPNTADTITVEPTVTTTLETGFVPKSTSHISSLSSIESHTTIVDSLTDISTVAPSYDDRITRTESEASNLYTKISGNTNENAQSALTSSALPNANDPVTAKPTLTPPSTTEFATMQSSQTLNLSGGTFDTTKADPLTTFSDVETKVPTPDEQETPSQSGTTNMSTFLPDSSNQNPQSASTFSALPNTADTVTVQQTVTPTFETESVRESTSYTSSLSSVKSPPSTADPLSTVMDISTMTPIPGDQGTKAETKDWSTTKGESRNPQSASTSEAVSNAGETVTVKPSATPCSSTEWEQTGSTSETPTDLLSSFADKSASTPSSHDQRTPTESETTNWSTPLVESTTTYFTDADDYFKPDPAVNESIYAIPTSFKIGATSSAYQTEGAWNSEGKAPSIQDDFYHRKGGANADVACNAYNEYQLDVKLLQNITLQTYHFSMSWSRLLPTARSLEANQAAINFYDNLLRALGASNIEPVVTLHHWDVPSGIENGWLNSSAPDYFLDYATFAFSLFGNRVRRWILLYDPVTLCVGGYETGEIAPGLIDLSGTAAYKCLHNQILAHSMAYRAYKEDFADWQQGEVGSTLSLEFGQPLNPSSQVDVAAAQRYMEATFSWFAYPLLTGEYPETILRAAAGRLPSFTSAQKSLIKGAFDYLGLKHSSARLCTEGKPRIATPFYEAINVTTSLGRNWTLTSSGLEAITPWSIREAVKWIDKTYSGVAVLVAENGYSGLPEDDAFDVKRNAYLSGYLRGLMRAVNEDGCNVIGYAVRSLTDSFEWNGGYNVKYGLAQVDFETTTRTRTTKQLAASFLSDILQNRNINYVALPAP